jgi:glycosyltransferase involved in cell wall biosynthesis
VLDSADSVLVLADGEANWLHVDYRYEGPYTRIPNGIDFDVNSPDVASEAFDAVIVGRIEERKNQVAIARAVSGVDAKIAFIGQANVASKRYVEEFAETVNRSRNVTWLGAIEHASVQQILRSSRVSISASFFEVLSLADFEAAAAGCNVIASTCGNTSEYLGNYAQYLDPFYVDEQLPGMLERALGSASLETPSVPTWDEVGDALVSEYERVLKSLS